MADDFLYDVFLSHSSKDKAIVGGIAERLRADGLRVWFEDWAIAPRAGKVLRARRVEEGLERSRVLVLCLSAHAFGSDWTQLEAGTFRFRDPLNKERRFIPLRLENVSIRGFLDRFSYISWSPGRRERSYKKLLESCRPVTKLTEEEKVARNHLAEKVIQLDFKADVLAYARSPNGKRILAGTVDSTVRLCDLETGRCLRTLRGHTKNVRSVAWSTDQSRALSGSNDSTLRLWDVETGRCLRVLKGHDGYVTCTALSFDGRRALSGSQDGTLRLWDLETGNCLRVIEGPAYIWSVAWSTDQCRALSGSDDKYLRLWDLEMGRCVRTFEGHEGAVFSLEWSINEKFAVSGSQDTTVRLWDVEAGHCLRVLEGHTQYLGQVAWSSDQRRILSGSADNTVRIWDVHTGHCLCVLEGHENYVNCVEWGGDQLNAFSGDYSGDIRIWDLSKFITEARPQDISAPALLHVSDQVQYTNAKVLLVGESGAGKTGLSKRLALNDWQCDTKGGLT